jgi:hypothetical protein
MKQVRAILRHMCFMPEARDREAHARLLIVDLRVGRLVRRGIRHGDRRTVKEVDVPAFPQPPGGHVSLQGLPRLVGHVREKGIGKALTSLAAGTDFRGARVLSVRQAVGDEAGDGGAARLVRTENLPEEDPERDQGRKTRSNQPVTIASAGAMLSSVRTLVNGWSPS